MRLRLSSSRTVLALALMLLCNVSFSQKSFEGVTWNKIADPDFILQLQKADKGEKTYAKFDWDTLKNDQVYAENFCNYMVTNKTCDYSTAVHKFTIGADKKASRSEMKVQLYGKYKDDGIYQMEGEVRFTKGKIGPSHVCQIWQNMIRSRNKILIYNTRPENNGTVYVPGNIDRTGTFKELTNVFTDYNNETGKWLKVNVIHFRGLRKVYVYLNGELHDSYENYQADGDYYFKFGAYGKVSGHSEEEAVSEWRNVIMFEGSNVASK